MSDKQFQIKDFPERGFSACVDCFGSGEYIIEVKGQDILFEWSDRFGPLPINKDGSEKRSIGPSHKFWRMVSLWNVQGRRLDGNRAIWHEPRKPVYITEKRGRRTFIIGGTDGEIGHDW